MKTRECGNKPLQFQFATKDDLLLIEDYMRALAPARPRKDNKDVAVVYARYSTKSQKDSSIDIQLEKCEAYAERHGIRLREEQYLFDDRGLSGFELDGRDALLEIRKLAREGAISKILIKSYDRLSRRPAHQALLFEEFTELGVEIHITGENGYGHLDEVKNLVLGLFAMKERQKMLADTSDAIKAAAQEGRSVGPEPYGYNRTRRKGILKIDAEEARIVRLIFYLFARGVQPVNIAGILNRNKIPAPKGDRWTDVVIKGSASRGLGILRNPKYIGLSIYGRMMTIKVDGRPILVPRDPNEWIKVRVDLWRIVSNRLWLRVQARLKEGEPRTQRIGVRERKSEKSTMLFHGHYFCACGAKMYGTFNGTKAQYRMLHCSDLNIGMCRNGKISAGRVDVEVLRTIRDNIVSLEALALYAREYAVGLAEAQKSVIDERNAVALRIGRLQSRIDGLTEALAEAGRAFERDDFRKRDRWVRERDACEQRLDQIPIPTAMPQPSVQDIAMLRREVDELIVRMPFVARTKEDWLLIAMLRRLIRRVDICKSAGDVCFSLEIHVSSAGFLRDVEEQDLEHPRDLAEIDDIDEAESPTAFAPVRIIQRRCDGASFSRPAQAERDAHLAARAQANVYGITQEDWSIVAPLVTHCPDARLMLDAALFALRTGRGLQRLPAPFDRNGLHQAIRRMVIGGVWTLVLDALETVQSPTVAGLDIGRFAYMTSGHAAA